MKKNLNALKTVVAITVLLLTFIACDKDYTTIGTDVIGNDHYLANNINYPAITYNKKLDAVQTNNLPSNLFGIYYDPIYGPSSANIVSQMSLQSNPLGINIQLDSVVLTVPYFSQIDVDNPTDEDGNPNYILDSLYGDSESLMKLSVYRNNYFLRNYDPNSEFEDSQKYYSNGATSLGEIIPASELESDLIYEDNQFKPSSSAISLMEINDEGDLVESGKLSPSFRVVFKDNPDYPDMQFWQELIMDKVGEPELSNSNNFRDYFRGLYFKVEDISGNGSMFMFDFSSSNANVSLYYKSVSDLPDEDNDSIPDVADADADGDGNIDEGSLDTDGDGIKDSADADADGDGIIDEEKEDINEDGIDDQVVLVGVRTSIINFSGNRINMFNNNYNSLIDDANNNANQIEGDEKLYLKGGEGSMAIVDLFGGIDSDEFAEFKTHQDQWLINEANLVFYEDENQVFEENHEYDRIFVYDANNNLPLVDYYLDTPVTSTPISSIANHLGRRYEDEFGNKKFKIRITEHINNILLKDSTNTKLGIVLSTNVNSIQNADILWNTTDNEVDNIPVGTILSPKGTVLYGNNTTNTGKKVKLEIYYTEPNN